MTTKPLKLVVKLKKIDYTGDNIGNDLTFGIEVNKEFTFLEQKIRAGKSQPIDRILYRLPVAEGEKIDFVASVVVTEQDLIFDDIGQGNTTFAFDVTPSGTKNHEFQVEVREGKKKATFSFQVEVAIKDFDYSRFDQALTYMYQELTVNAQSKDVQKIKDALNKGNDTLARTLWFNLVAKDHKWDHKPILAKKLGLENPPDYWFPIRGDSEHEWYYDIWSNIHYGFVGRAAGFAAQTLQDYAASGLPGAGKNDDGDVLSVQIGIDLWDEHQIALTQEQLHQAILSHLQDYLDIQQANPDVSVIIDWVDGNLR
jgi:hypothetical protein